MASSKVTIWLIIVLVILLGILGGLYLLPDRSSRQIEIEPSIKTIVVEKPNLVVRGGNLSRVDIYARPTDTGTTSAEAILWGQAEPDLGGGGDGLWLFLIPDEPSLIEEIYAEGFDAANNSVGRVTLNITGPTALYNTLWSSANAILLPLKVGQTGTVENLSLKVEKISSDNRCPIDAECAAAGDITVETRLSSNTVEEIVVINQSADAHSFGDFFIDIIGVTPVAKTDRAIESSDYIVTFSITGNVKP